MCGIFAAINTRSVTDNLLDGLSSLSYRGYDSAGIAILNDGNLQCRRAKGKLENLSELLKSSPITGSSGIAHTRWATHGLPNEKNAHPHVTEKVAVAHNGIVENYHELKPMLEEKGYFFKSETDSETIAQLITHQLDLGMSAHDAFCSALSCIRGNYSIVAIFQGEEEVIFATKSGSPLVIGRGDTGFYVSSDENALKQETKEITHLKDGDIAKIKHDSCVFFNTLGINTEYRWLLVDSEKKQINDKAGYAHFMQKEISEQADILALTWNEYFDKHTQNIVLPKSTIELSSLERLSIIACGTSYFAGMVAKYWLEELTRLPVDVDIASEYRYRNAPVNARTAGVFISQSGETADTLAALSHLQSFSLPGIALVNVLNSTLARQAETIIPTFAGPEIGVASTKAFTSQLATLLILSISTAKANFQLSHQREKEIFSAIEHFPPVVSNFLRDSQQIKDIAATLSDATSMLFLGRGISYPIAEEGALKMKEITYVHAEAYPAGELKHGPLALVDETVPVVVIAPPDKLFDKTVSNLREVSSRGGKVILLSNKKGIEKCENFIHASIELPDVDALLHPILYTLPLQLLAYYAAVFRGNDVDQPRNLAKSVTVE